MLTHEKAFVPSPVEGNILGSHLSAKAEMRPGHFRPGPALARMKGPMIRPVPVYMEFACH